MLTALDGAILAGYLGLTVWLGIALRGRQESVNDYFTARGALPGWFGSLLVGLSIAATFFSGISFLAYPGMVFNRGLVVVAGMLPLVLYWVIVRHFFLPRFLRRTWTEPYAILEERFGRPVRRLAAGLYVAARIGWMAALIYAPAIALLAAMRLDPQWFWPLVLAIGLSCTLYSTFGGIRGIIVTDALQMTIIFVALGLTLAFIGRNLPLSPGEVWQSLRQSGHLGDWSLSFSLTRLSVWAVLCGVTLNSIGSYVGDQMSLQRYMTASSLDEAKRSFLVNLVGVLVVVLTLCAIGLALTAWYQGLPPDRAPARPDDVLPLFVATELPAGIAGLILAAILAATMSSMSSGINALAASLNMDFRRGASSPGESPRGSLRNARLLSLAIGLASTVSAGLVFHLGHLFDIAQRILGVFMAPLAMVLLLAVTPWRLRPHRVAAGLAAGSVAGGFVALTPNLAAVFPAVPPVHSLWVAVAASLVTLTVCLSGLEGRCKPARAGSRP